MKKIIIFVLLAVAGALGLIWWFDVEQVGGTVSDVWTSLWSGAQGIVTSGILSASDIMGYAQNAGFSGDNLNTAIAVALAESSGNPGTVGDLTVTPGGSIGLWQINLKAHPEYTADSLVDPQTNANAAYAVFGTSGWGAWTTYNSGAYNNFLAQAQAATGGTQTANTTDASSDDSGGDDSD